MPVGSSTVEKAVGLLGLFTEQRPFIGLSEIARLSGFSKATTLRFLVSLEAKGFVEQDPVSKDYHLGPAVLRYAQVREASFPLQDAVHSILVRLVEATGETAHASVMAGDALATIGQVESRRSNRVIIDPGEALPFHATASGIAYLAFAKPQIVEAALARELTAYTRFTLTDRERLRARIGQARTDGFARSSETYEEEVVGFAAPYFGPSSEVSGAIAVAVPKARATADLERRVVAEVRAAAQRLTASRGGRPCEPASEPSEAEG